MNGWGLVGSKWGSLSWGRWALDRRVYHLTGEEGKPQAHWVWRTVGGTLPPSWCGHVPGVAGDKVTAERGIHGGERREKAWDTVGACDTVMGDLGRREIQEKKGLGRGQGLLSARGLGGPSLGLGREHLRTVTLPLPL